MKNNVLRPMYNVCTMHVHSKCNHYIHVHYCIERSANISITRITFVKNISFCYVAISNNIPTHADFQVDGYHGC